jgi:hypothetical protein
MTIKQMFIVHLYDWNTEVTRYVGIFATTEAATLWIEAQVKNDNEDVDYEICPLVAP